MLWIFLFFSMSLVGMESPVTVSSTASDHEPYGSKMHRSVSTETQYDSEEERELCNRAIDCLYKRASDKIKSRLNPHVRDLARRDSLDRRDNGRPESFETMRKLSLDQSIDEEEHAYIHDLVGRAIEVAFDNYEDRVDRRWNRKRVATVSTIASILSAGISAIITAYSK